MTPKQGKNVASQLSKINKKKAKKERFITMRMWISTIISALYNDRGKVPDNIGNNILITNNQYITKYSLNSILMVREMSEETPVAWVSDMLKKVKDTVGDVVIDVTFKNAKHKIDIKSSGLDNRIRQWEITLDSPYATEKAKKRAARLLYTAELAKRRTPMFKSRVFITVRAQTGKKLDQGIVAVITYLESIGANYKFIKSNMQDVLEYATMMSDKASKRSKDMPGLITSTQTLCELLPSTQGLNDAMGTFLGIDRVSGGPYFINFCASSKAKNGYIVGLSGFGKTFLVISWLLDMYTQGFNCCIMDIKGTEFGSITKAFGGITLSMRQTSTSYVNTFIMDKDDLQGADPKVHFDARFSLSKEVIKILCDLPADLVSLGEALTEEFLQSVYLQKGVLPDNPNTWFRSSDLTPYSIYDFFYNYLSPAVKSKYMTVADKMLMRLKIYMSRTGSSSHMFRDAYQYKTILDSKILTFDFGILESGGGVDPIMFKLRVLFMSLINDEYVAYKKRKGEWTLKVLEESQIAEDYLLSIYAKEFTLRRASNQVTMLLGNSVAALQSNPIARPILENINILAIGVVHRTSREYLIKEFGLDKYQETLDAIATNPDFENTFLLVNMMQKDATIAQLKAFVPERVAKGKVYKVVDVIDEG